MFLKRIVLVTIAGFGIVASGAIAIAQLKGETLDQTFLQDMILHHMSAVHLSHTESIY